MCNSERANFQTQDPKNVCVHLTSPNPFPLPQYLPATPAALAQKLSNCSYSKAEVTRKGRIPPSSLSPCPQPRAQTAEAGAGGGARRDFYLKLRNAALAGSGSTQHTRRRGLHCFFCLFFFLIFIKHKRRLVQAGPGEAGQACGGRSRRLGVSHVGPSRRRYSPQLVNRAGC